MRGSVIEGGYDHLATRADVSDLKAELKTDVSDLKAEIYQMENRLIRWMIGLMVGSIVGAASVALAVQRIIGS